MANVSVKRVTRDKYESEIEDKTVEGWQVKSRNDNVAIMTKAGNWGSGLGHLVVLLLTGWWTLLLGNLAYALYKHYTTAGELHVKVEG